MLSALGLELDFPVQGHFCVKAALRLALARGCCGRGRQRVESRGWQHHRWAEGEIHRVHGRAVEFVEVQAWDIVVGVGDLLVSLCGAAVVSKALPYML
jgi:hypothetical protein